MRAPLSFVAGLAAALWTAGARAEEARLSAGGALAIGSDAQPGEDVTVFAPTVALRYQRSPVLAATLIWGAASIGGAGAKEAGLFQPANPWLLFSRARPMEAGGWQLGVGATLPLARVRLGDGGRTSRSALNHAMGVHGLWNLWSWAPDRLAVPLVGRIERRLGKPVSVAGEGGAAVLWPLRAPERDVAAVAQAGVDLCLHASLLALCGRGQVVVGTPAFTQSAAGARLWLMPERWRLYAALLFNLDEPLGAGRGARLWGASVGREVRTW